MTEAQIDFMFSALLFISSIACLSPNICFATAINDFSNKHLSCAWIGNHKQAWRTAAIWLQAQLYSIWGALFFGGHLELYFIYLGLLNLIFICSCKLPEWSWTWKGSTFFPPNKETDDLIGKWDTYGIVFTLEQAHLWIKPLDLPSFFSPLFLLWESLSMRRGCPFFTSHHPTFLLLGLLLCCLNSALSTVLRGHSLTDLIQP